MRSQRIFFEATHFEGVTPNPPKQVSGRRSAAVRAAFEGQVAE
jgi:hypothetical protein